MSSRLGIGEERTEDRGQGEVRGVGALDGVGWAVRGGKHRSSIAYRLAAGLSDDVHAAVTDWPEFELWTVGVQLVRAADSIGANIAEGMGRDTRADQRRFFLIARGSLYETEHWLERAVSRGLIKKQDGFGARTSELGRVLSGLISSRRP